MDLVRFFVLSLACLLTACCGEGTPNHNPDLQCDASALMIDSQQPDSTPSIDAAVPVCGCPALQPGDMFTVCGPSGALRYIMDPQGEVMYFPNGINSDVFASWRDNAENLVAITQPCFDSLWTPVMYPGGVNYRPGSHVVKRVGANFPQLYVILPGNTLAPISAQVAAELCVPADVGGVGCEPIEIADAFWPSFIRRWPEIMIPHVYPGLLFVIGNDTTVYYTDVNGITIHEVPNIAFELNHFQRRFVRRVSPSAVSSTSMGAPMRIYETLVSDPTQGG